MVHVYTVNYLIENVLPPPIRFYPCKQYVTNSIKKFVCTYSTQHCILIIY
jgi:hypothetical protein